MSDDLLTDVEDLILVKKMQADDTEAFDALVEHHMDQFWSIALGICRHHENAEDALQNALYKMFEKRHTFHADGAFVAWASTIVRNMSLMSLRRSKRRSEVQLEDFVKYAQEASPLESPDRILIIRQIRAALVDALERLGPKYRIPFELATFEGLTMHEIGERIGESEGCAKTRMFRAREKLRRSLIGAHREFSGIG